MTYFTKTELQCPHCGKAPIHPHLIETLDTIREHIKRPINIESGYRCPYYNNTLKNSVPNSGHTTGQAADIRAPGMTNKQLGDFIKHLHSRGLLPYLTYSYLIKGKTNTSVHIGTDKKPRKHIFAY